MGRAEVTCDRAFAQVIAACLLVESVSKYCSGDQALRNNQAGI